jgi:hypothetical protein
LSVILNRCSLTLTTLAFPTEQSLPFRIILDYFEDKLNRWFDVLAGVTVTALTMEDAKTAHERGFCAD